MTSCLLNALLETKTRNEEAVLSIAGVEGEVKGNRTINVKVADGERFLLYGPSALALLEKSHGVNGSTTLDFEVTFRYSHLKEGKQVFLYSDRFRIRFMIINEKFQLQVFHTKGIGRTSPIEVAALIEDHLVKTMRRRKLEPRIEILEEQY